MSQKNSPLPHHYNCIDIHLLNVIKKDLIELGFLVKTRKSQPLSNKVFSSEQFTLNLMPGKKLFQSEKVEFDYKGEFKLNSESDFIFQIDELLRISEDNKITPRKFLKNYFTLMKMNEEGFHVKSIE